MALVLAFSALCILGHDTQGAIVGSVLDNGNGTYTYSYSIDNTGGAFPVVAFSLEFPVPSAAIDWDQTTGITLPVNWAAVPGIPTLGLSAQDFLSLNPIADVSIGGILAGFSFVSALQPGPVSYNQFGAAGQTRSGTVVGATGVPEPGTALAGIFVLGFAAFQSTSRRSARIAFNR